MKRSVVLLLMLGGALSIAACEATPAETQEGLACEAAAECVDAKTDLTCVGDWLCSEGACAFACVIGSPCDSDEACGVGMQCKAGHCMTGSYDPPEPGCVTDEDCQEAGTGNVCVEGYCSEDFPPPPECESDDACGADEVCVNGACVEVEPPPPPCNPTGCSGEICANEPVDSTCDIQPWFVCLELTTCGAFGPDGGCAWEPTEAFMSCLEPFEKRPEECGDNAPCDEGYVCVEGTCVEKDPEPECSEAKPCKEGLVCVEGTCVEKDPEPECSEAKPCKEGLVCVEGICVEKAPELECSDAKPCKEGLVCVEGTCVEKDPELECSDAKPCKEGLECVEGTCVEKDPEPECSDAKPCKEGFKCVEGTCVDTDPEPECQATGCSYELCAPEPVSSPCVEEPWFVCLEYTSCGNFGTGGSCDWKMTDAFWLCLQDFKDPVPETCESDSDCDEGYACECMAGDECLTCDVACEWKCVEVPEPEADCSSTEMCDEGLVCSVEYGACLSNPECAPKGPCTDECWGHCVPPEDEGAECYSDLDCADDEYCDFGWNTPNGIPIMEAGACKEKNPCVVTGCFDHLCADEPIDEICKEENWEPWYACYPLAKCGLFGPDATCGWQETEDFDWCVKNAD